MEENFKNQINSFNKSEEEKEIKLLKEEINNIAIEMAIENEINQTYAEKIKELEKIIKNLLKDGENYQMEIVETLTQENDKVLCKIKKYINEKKLN